MVQESTNVFSGGLVSDLNPITVPNNVLTDCLNGTLLTFNGNELVLQNDMGNTIIQDAKLTDGFIPIGMKEYGGILYIISTNPDTNETEIGSFPSPEEVKGEKIDTTEFNIPLNNEGTTLYKNHFITNKNLNSGDSFIIFLKNSLIKEHISSSSSRKFYKVKLLSIENGVENDITSLLRHQIKYVGDSIVDNDYWFVQLDDSEPFQTIEKYNKDIQRYKFKKRGKLALKFELEDIDEFKIVNGTSNYPKLLLKDDNYFYLDFNMYTKALATLKSDKIKIDITLIDPNGKDPDQKLPTVEQSINFEGLTENTTKLEVNIGDTYEKIVDYTITPINEYYDITFNNFIINEIIDLSIDPERWVESKNKDYMFQDYFLKDYDTI